jgi:hypothetical protein
LARPRKDLSESFDLTHGQAHYVLGRLIGDRRISAAEVRRYLGEMHREIEKLEERLHSLRTAAGGAIASAVQKIRRGPGRPAAAAVAAVAAPEGGKRRRRRRRSSALTPEQRASRQLQGRYLGLIRQIPASRRAQFAKIAKEKGREAAIRDMQSAINK